MEIKNNKNANRFEYSSDGYTAYIEYIARENHLVIFDVEIPKYLESQGAANELMKHTIDFAKKNKLKLFPMHSLMTKFMAHNQYTHDLLLIK